MKILDDKIKQKIIAVLSALFPNTRIYLFGSRARGTNAEWADIDIALDADKPLSLVDIDEARSMFVESNIMYKIDIVDFNQVNETMKNAISKDKIIWKP